MGTGRGGPARSKVTCGGMFLPVLRETPYKPSVWEGSSKSPCLLKNIKVSPIFSHFTDQRELSRAREGQKSQGNDKGRPYSSPACSWAPPGAGPSPSLGFRLARQPHKTRLFLPEIARPLSGSSVHARKPHGQPCLFICNDQSRSCLMQKRAPF